MTRKARKRFGKQPGGFVMFLTLTFAVLVGLASVLAITPSVGEALKAGQELRDKRLLFLADGGATLCRGELKNRLNSALSHKLATVTILSTSLSSYINNNDPAQFLLDYVYENGNAAVLGAQWTKDSTTVAHVPVSSGTYRCTLTLTSRVAPSSTVSAVGSTALFRYLYVITGTSTEGLVTRTVSLQGTFSLLVFQNNFARYALFTNDNGGVYIAGGFNYYGPVHTNGEFNIKQNPHFWDTVESVNTKVKYGNGAAPAVPVELAADHNGTTDVPIFDKGLTLGAANIPMPDTGTTPTAQKAVALTGYSGSTSSTGVYLGASGGAVKGGIYVKGDAALTLSVFSPGVAQYAIVQGSTTTTVQVNAGSNQTTVKVGSGSPTTYTGVPNGLLYVDGNVTSLAGTLEKNTQLTVAATNDVTITNNLLYQTYTPTSGSTPAYVDTSTGATNLMGIVSWNNNIHIGTTAPDDVTICATLMAPSATSGEGQVLVDSYNSTTLGHYPNSQNPRGNATVLGGVIMNTYGAFGTVAGNPPSQTFTGYARNFIYDKRMSQGSAPPYYPTTGAVTNTQTGVTDRPNWAQTN